MSKIEAFKKANSDIAIFQTTGESRMKASIQYAQMVNKKGFLKIGERLIVNSNEKTIYILDGDVNKLETAQRMQSGESADKIVVMSEQAKDGSFLRSGCVGQAGPELTITQRAESVGSPQKFKTESRLAIYNWSYPKNDGSLESNVFVIYYAVAKSYKRGIFGAWFSSSLQKQCAGSVYIKSIGCPVTFPQSSCSVNNNSYSDSWGSSEVTFPIAGAYSYYTTYVPPVDAPDIYQSCSINMKITTFTSIGNIVQDMQ